MLQDFASLWTMITPLEDERKTARPSASFHRSNEIGHQDILYGRIYYTDSRKFGLYCFRWRLHWHPPWVQIKTLMKTQTRTLGCSNILVVYYCCISCLTLLVGTASLSALTIRCWASRLSEVRSGPGPGHFFRTWTWPPRPVQSLAGPGPGPHWTGSTRVGPGPGQVRTWT